MWGFSQIPGSNDTDMLPGLYNLHLAERFITADYNQSSYIPVGACRISSNCGKYEAIFFVWRFGFEAGKTLHTSMPTVPEEMCQAKTLWQSFCCLHRWEVGGDQRYGNCSLPKWSSYFRGILKRKRCLTCQDVFVKLEENKGRSEKKQTNSSMVEWIAKKSSQIEWNSGILRLAASEAIGIVKNGRLVKVTPWIDCPLSDSGVTCVIYNDKFHW